MTEHFSFFDAIQDSNGHYDREYNAQQFTDYFKSLVTTGVMKGAYNQLEVTTNGANMESSVKSGIAFVEGRYYYNDSLLELTHDTEVVGLSRIDRIVVRLDLNTENRYVRAFIKKGTPSTNPIPPTLTRNSTVYEISLAQVKIIGGQTFIAVNAVTDERGKNDICPWAGSNILPSYNENALATHISNLAMHVPHRLCSLLKSSNQSVLRFDRTFVTFETSISDDYSMKPSNDNTKIICQEDGIYSISISLKFSPTTNGSKGALVVKNGVNVNFCASSNPPSGIDHWTNSTVMMKLVKGDYLQVGAYHDTDDSISVYAGSSISVLRVY